MNLEELLSNTNSNSIYLFDKQGNTIEFYHKEGHQTKENIIPFGATVFNMTQHYFNDFLKSELSNLIIRSNKEQLVLVKYHNDILCFSSNKNINIGVLDISLRKEFNK
ncbi:conserved protein of unknown function [Tenacibaculum sp. 190130A14a]|uniref:HTH LytTR-type domain-containing protein n=1 Tax=Tenacibaculum polynesiense TaxID=3137857 RepID=A0ABM9P814_9FLAO